MPEPSHFQRERDLVLASGQYALVLDKTKGHVTTHIGPTKMSLSTTDTPVVYNPIFRAFDECEQDQAAQSCPRANEGDYIILENPPVSGTAHAHPTGTAPQTPELQVGVKVNVPGPVSFALWPGQVATPVKGHRLRSNQYLVCRVYNADAAKANWGQAVVDVQTTTEGEGDPKTAKIEPTTSVAAAEQISMGKLFIVKGTAVSFYIPPTGVEVVQDESGEYIRDAVTLERLEYCILMDENGTIPGI